MVTETPEIKDFLNASLLSWHAIANKTNTTAIIDLYAKSKAALLTEWRHICFHVLPGISQARAHGFAVAETIFDGGLERKIGIRDLVKTVTEMYFVAADGLVSEKLTAEGGEEKRPEQGSVTGREDEEVLERYEKMMVERRERREGETYRTLAFFGALREGLRIRLEALMLVRDQAKGTMASGGGGGD